MWMREEGGEVENRRRILLKKLLQAIPGTLIKHLSLGTSTCASAPSSSSGRVRVCVRIRVCVCVFVCAWGREEEGDSRRCSVTRGLGERTRVQRVCPHG